MRTVAVAMCRRGDDLLVERGYDRVARRGFYRAIGGGVEAGESPAEAVVREWREELGVCLVDLTPLGVLDNRFVYEGRPGHERVVVFAARLAEPAHYRCLTLDATDPAGLRHSARWVPLRELASGPIPLYPAGLLALVRAGHS